MLCNETAFNPVQAWLSGFAALCRSTTTVGTASIHHAQATQMFGEKASVSGQAFSPNVCGGAKCLDLYIGIQYTHLNFFWKAAKK